MTPCAGAASATSPPRAGAAAPPRAQQAGRRHLLGLGGRGRGTSSLPRFLDDSLDAMR
jgi:hypothetical protein